MSLNKSTWPNRISTVLITFGLAAALAVGVHFGVSKIKNMAEASALASVSELERSFMVKEGIQTRKDLERAAVAADTVRIIPPQKIEEQIPARGKFVAADLDTMVLYLYENGKQKSSYKILSKGKPGSNWETPTGKYAIKSKGETMYSQLGDVYMPYSMHFYGNFLIHGWPYHPDGTPVPQGYSGGCIRLSNVDAKEVYDFISVGTPLYVSESLFDIVSAQKKVGQKHVSGATVPGISASAYLVANLETGEVYAEKNSSKVFPIASITKLMTAVVANESMGSNRKIRISENAVNTSGDSANLKAGEVFTLSNIFYPLLLVSSNDAAVAIAEEYGVSRFVSSMNEKAGAIGMISSNFADSSGISPLNTSTANDLFLLASYLHEKKEFLLDITRQPEKMVASLQEEHLLANMNVFSAEKSFLGGKTGFTLSAKETFLSLFEVEKDGKKVPIAFIVLGSNDRKRDVGMLLEWVRTETMATVAAR